MTNIRTGAGECDRDKSCAGGQKAVGHKSK